MIKSAGVAEIKQVLIQEAQTDIVGLWALLWEVRQVMPSSSTEEVKTSTLEIIHEGLREGHIVAGQFMDRDEDTVAFLPWKLSVDEIVQRIDREWATLGREPTLGEVVWFVSPHLLPVTARRDPMGKDWKVL